MKKLIFLSLIFLASLASAAPQSYSINSELSINGKIATKAKIITLDNHEAMITQKDEQGREVFIAVTPSEGQGQIKGRKAILMKFVVGFIENGQRKILGTPQIMALESKKAEISVGGPGRAQEDFSLSVIAERQ